MKRQKWMDRDEIDRYGKADKPRRAKGDTSDHNSVTPASRAVTLVYAQLRLHPFPRPLPHSRRCNLKGANEVSMLTVGCLRLFRHL